MTNSHDTYATGTVTTWAGTTHVRASAKGIRAVTLPSWRGPHPPAGSPSPRIELARVVGDAAESHLRQALDELAGYFAGERPVFTVALDPQGPGFYRQVWSVVAAVPFGETRSYGEIARAVRAPDDARAVGAANGANPVAPFVPCHRIIGSDGSLTGYGPGLGLKERLLAMEGAMPRDADDYDAWVARSAARLGIHPDEVLLGVHALSVYCRPECARARRSTRVHRLFRSVTEAQTAGFQACERCRPATMPSLWAVG